MNLESVDVHSFRNLTEVNLSLHSGLNILWGANAQGKTNLLEAVHYLATGRSFRTTRDEECLPLNAAGPTLVRLDGRLIRGETRHAITVSFNRQTKSVWIDDKALSRLTDLWGLLPVVLFTPDDLRVIEGGPAGRREWLDIAVSQSSRPYLEALKRFTRSLRQRNALLRQPPPHSSSWETQVASYETPLAEAAGHLFVARREFIANLAQKAQRRHFALSGNQETLDLRYDHFLQGAMDDSPSVEDAPDLESIGPSHGADLYGQLLQQNRSEDIARGQTLNGPHRDDLILLINDSPARSFASRGQTRTIALSLRLAEVDLIREMIGHTPLLLLDDILSELDVERLLRLLESLAEEQVQTLITAVDVEPLRTRLPSAKIQRIQGGRLVS